VTVADETARAELRRRVDLALADSFVLGWREMVLLELDQMRAELPYADTLELRLVCGRPSDEGR
jgi:hypothetical protein